MTSQSAPRRFALVVRDQADECMVIRTGDQPANTALREEIFSWGWLIQSIATRVLTVAQARALVGERREAIEGALRPYTGDES